MRTLYVLSYGLFLSIFVLCGCTDFGHTIDLKATASAPWKQNAEVFRYDPWVLFAPRTTMSGKPDRRVTRRFLGVTTNGLYLVQDFYANGRKLTDPFLIIKSGDVTRLEISTDSLMLSRIGLSSNVSDLPADALWTILDGYIEGRLALWEPTGHPIAELFYENGQLIRFTKP